MMKTELRDSGTTGRYASPPQPFSSEAYGSYSGNPADYTTQFYALLKQWRYETLTSSSTDEIVKNEAFRRIVGMGEVVLPLIISELKNRPDFLVIAMSLITSENPVGPKQAGDMTAMAEAWIDWYEHRW